MPTLSQLQDTTTPIKIKRGQISFTLNAALEKLGAQKNAATPPSEGPSEGVTYADLQREEADIAKAAALLRIELNRRAGALSEAADPDRIREQIARVRMPGVTSKAKIAKIDLSEVPKDELQAAFETLAKGIETEIDKLDADFDANEAARLLNYAKRLAYLVASTDLEPDETGRALVNGVNKSPQDFEHNARLYFECFTPQLLRGCLEEVEGAVYGPLVTSGS